MGNAHGEVHWTELNTHEPAKSAEFYKKTLGWEIDEMDMGAGEPYRVARVGDEMVSGIFAMTGPEMAHLPNHWLTYFAIRDADKMAAEVEAAGGKLLRPMFEVPNVGRILMVEDSTGAVSGFIQPSEMG